jgi:GDP-D-mannose dehydratase
MAFGKESNGRGTKFYNIKMQENIANVKFGIKYKVK